jgi:hypothetical protein
VKQDREILLSYMAACVQYPGKKFQWSPLLQGVPGNGKSFLGQCLTHAIGEKYTHKVNPQDLGNVFNAWLSNKLLVLIEEVHAGNKQDIVETLKWMITDARVPMQAKGQGQITGDNRANFFMTTNHADAIQKTKSDRRFCVFYTAQQVFEDIAACGMGGNYFPKLYAWANGGGYAIINNYLREYVIPDALNPATSCHRAPATSSTDAVIANSITPAAQHVKEAIHSGLPGFVGGWVSSMTLDKLLENKRITVALNKRGDLLAEIGYIPHPKLRSGRVNNAIIVEGGKPVL